MTKKRKTRQLWPPYITLTLSAGIFVTGFLLGSVRPALAQGNQPASVQTLFEPFWETWTLLHSEFVDQPLDDVALMEGAIDGMLATLDDQHTRYMTPQEFALQNADLEGQFEGIGAQVERTDGGDFFIVTTLPMHDCSGHNDPIRFPLSCKSVPSAVRRARACG